MIRFIHRNELRLAQNKYQLLKVSRRARDRKTEVREIISTWSINSPGFCEKTSNDDDHHEQVNRKSLFYDYVFRLEQH